MDFRTIFQLRDKKIWWLDVIFYFVMSLLVATIFCYLVFIAKNIIQRNQIKDIEVDLQTVGTQDQLDQEKEVLLYKQKINSFTELMKNHEFASNVFAFLEGQTQPSVWFTNFSLDEKNAKVQLSGVSQDMDTFSRQTFSFETNEYVKDLGTINSSLGDEGEVNFNFSLSLDNKIFSYLVNLKNQKIEQVKQEEATLLTASLSSKESEEENNQNQEVQQTSTTTVQTEPGVTKNNEKKIYSFDIPLDPEIVGQIDHTNYTISATVPSGTDITNLAPTIIISPKATIFPGSDVIQNFTQPVVYEVKAEDGTTQNYKVTVSVAASSTTETSEQPTKQSGLIKIFLITALISFIVIVVLIIVLFIKNRKNKNR